MSNQDNSDVTALLGEMETFISDYDSNQKGSLQNMPNCSSFGDLGTAFTPGSSSAAKASSGTSNASGNKRRISTCNDGQQQEQDSSSSPITAFLQNQMKAANERKQKKRQRLVSAPTALLSNFESSCSSPFNSENDFKLEARTAAPAEWTDRPRPAAAMQQQPRLPTSQQALRPEAGGNNPRQNVQQQRRSSLPAPAPSAGSDVSSAAAAVTAGDTKFYLHRVCRHFSSQKDVVEIALALDPQAIRRKADDTTKKAGQRRTGASISGIGGRPMLFQQHRIIQERYSYPINIALQSKASMEVIELLVNQGPDVLLEKDGYERTGTLSIALCHQPHDLDLVDLILFANWQGIMVTDRKLNYPLHIACAKGASVDVLKRLYSHYPAALFQQNFNSETPFDIARRSCLLDEEALSFLQDQFNQGCLKVAQNNITCSVPGTH